MSSKSEKKSAVLPSLPMLNIKRLISSHQSQYSLHISLQIFKTDVDFILGKILFEEFIDDIWDIANSVSGLSNPYEIKVDYMGNYVAGVLHISIDKNMSFEQTHRIKHQIRDKLMEEKSDIRYTLVHTCPLEGEYKFSQKSDK